MKKIAILLLLLVTSKGIIHAQTYSAVKTPKCSTVDAYIRPEFLTPELIALYDTSAREQYPRAKLLNSSTTTFNCHGYAWHLSDGGSTRWIGLYSTSNEDIYWLDGSYVQVSSSPIPTPYATKVSYSSDDHSAITTNTSGILISKWGSWPLMEHYYSYCPYNFSSLKYYAIPVSGSDLICSSSSQNYQSITPSLGITNYLWSAGTYLTPSSQTGTTNNFSVAGTVAGNGYSHINVQISSSCAGTTVFGQKRVYVGLPGGPEFSPFLCVNTVESFTFTENEMIGASTFNYQSLSANLSINGSGNYVSASASAAGDFPFTMQPVNSCGTSSPTTLYATAYNCWKGYNFIAYPNATDFFLNIDIPEKFEDPILTISLRDERGQVKRTSIVVSGEGKEKVTFEVSDLKDGIYYLEIKGESGKQQTMIIKGMSKQ